MACPLSKKNSIAVLIPEMLGVIPTFALFQCLLAKIARLPLRVPSLIGGAIPLSYYTISYLEHQAYPETTVHSPKHWFQRALVITLLTALIIRSYRETPHQIPYSWIPIPLLTAFIAANLSQTKEKR